LFPAGSSLVTRRSPLLLASCPARLITRHPSLVTPLAMGTTPDCYFPAARGAFLDKKHGYKPVTAGQNRIFNADSGSRFQVSSLKSQVSSHCKTVVYLASLASWRLLSSRPKIIQK
jgi:hypothetical protein